MRQLAFFLTATAIVAAFLGVVVASVSVTTSARQAQLPTSILAN
jgi:hypothetical protein